MSRLKLGLFGTDRSMIVSEGASSQLVNARTAEAQERLAGLTPIEIAAVEAMSRGNGAALAAR